MGRGGDVAHNSSLFFYSCLKLAQALADPALLCLWIARYFLVYYRQQFGL